MEERYICTWLVGVQISTVTLESSVDIPQKNVRMQPSYDPAISHFDIYLNELKLAYHSNIVMSGFIAAQFAIAKLWNLPRYMSMDKDNLVYVHSRALLNHKEWK